MSSLQPIPSQFPEQEASAPQVLGGFRNEGQRNRQPAATQASTYGFDAPSEPGKAKSLSIAVISPSEARRGAAVAALEGCAGSDITEFTNYPPDLGEVRQLIEGKYAAVIIDLDSNPGYALELVKSVGAIGVTVVVYSENSDPELLVCCMQAGARGFLTFPFTAEVMGDTLMRALARRQEMRIVRRPSGKLYAFMGSKGGAGTTTVACNFAVGLAKNADQSTLLIDLDLPLGDAALNLGINPEFSAIDALREVERLDERFLAQLVVKHDTGLSVLAAPGMLVPYKVDYESIDRLLQVARQEFDNVVVDLGSKLDLVGTSAYRDATTIYLVTQASIPELRNSNRIVTQFFSAPVPKLEIVINRYEPRMLGVTEEHITKALTRPAQWKIPNDYQTVQNKQISATPLVLSDSAISRRILEMVHSVNGKSTAPAKKRKGFSFNFFG